MEELLGGASHHHTWSGLPQTPRAAGGFPAAGIAEAAVCHLLRRLTLCRYLRERTPPPRKAMPQSSGSARLHLFFMFFKLVNHMTINRNTLDEERRGNCCLSGQVV